MEEAMLIKVRELLARGYTNPSAITSILYLNKFEGRFMEIRKGVEFEYKKYQQENSRK